MSLLKWKSISNLFIYLFQWLKLPFYLLTWMTVPKWTQCTQHVIWNYDIIIQFFNDNVSLTFYFSQQELIMIATILIPIYDKFSSMHLVFKENQPARAAYQVAKLPAVSIKFKKCSCLSGLRSCSDEFMRFKY